MQTALRIETTVLPGHRLEMSAPELPVSATVEVIVVLPENQERPKDSIVAFLESLPPGPRSYPTWEEFEKAFQQERNSWDR